MSAPCGHQAGPVDGCRWCTMATTKDTRYAMLWWGMTIYTVPGQGPAPPPPAPRQTPLEIYACKFRLDPTGETVACPTCTGPVRLKVFGCHVYGQCVIDRQVEGMQTCATCNEREAPEEQP